MLPFPHSLGNFVTQIRLFLICAFRSYDLALLILSSQLYSFLCKPVFKIKLLLFTLVISPSLICTFKDISLLLYEGREDIKINSQLLFFNQFLNSLNQNSCIVESSLSFIIFTSDQLWLPLYSYFQLTVTTHKNNRYYLIFFGLWVTPSCAYKLLLALHSQELLLLSWRTICDGDAGDQTYVLFVRQKSTHCLSLWLPKSSFFLPVHMNLCRNKIFISINSIMMKLYLLGRF